MFKSLCDEEIIEYNDTEPMRRCYFKTKEREYSLRLWDISQINETKVWIEATLSYDDGTCFLKPYKKPDLIVPFNEEKARQIALVEKEKTALLDLPAPETELDKELHNLALNQLNRKLTYLKYLWFINHLECILDNGKKPKGIRYRKRLAGFLRYAANHTYKTEGEEYHDINKFGRGYWDEMSIRNSFNKTDQKNIIEIAKGYGAFDY